jgi:hypothetical protein
LQESLARALSGKFPRNSKGVVSSTSHVIYTCILRRKSQVEALFFCIFRELNKLQIIITQEIRIDVPGIATERCLSKVRLLLSPLFICFSLRRRKFLPSLDRHISRDTYNCCSSHQLFAIAFHCQYSSLLRARLRRGHVVQWN